MMTRLAICLTLLPLMASAQGWGNVSKPKEEKGFTWTDPLWPDFWMAWTPATLVVFVGIFSAMAVVTGIELRRPGGAERRGVLGLTTTRGDRLFISLLGSAWIFILWLGVMGTPLWTPLGIALAWGVFCFWKV